LREKAERRNRRSFPRQTPDAFFSALFIHLSAYLSFCFVCGNYLHMHLGPRGMDEFVLTTARKPMEERETEREREGAPPDESSELFFFLDRC